VELVTYEIRRRQRDHSPIVIAPLGDIQWNGVRGPTAKEALREYIDRTMALGAYYIGMGDYPLPVAARILTRRGFLTHLEVRIGEPVLAYDASRDRCVWTPLRRINRPGPLPMMQLRSKSFAARSTPQHTWVVSQQWWERSGERVFRREFKPYLTSTENLRSHHRIVVAAPVDDEQESVLTPEEARVLAWLCTDGHLRTNPTLCGYIMQTKEPYRTQLRGHLAGWITSEEARHSPMSRFHLKTKRLRALLETAGLEPQRFKEQMPSLVTRLSHDARLAMWTAMVEAEGWQEHGHWRFSQKPGPILDAFRILSALLGYRLSRGKLNKAGVVTVAVMDYRRMATVTDMSITTGQSEECWCPGTDYGTWVAELEGQVTITGNTDFLSPSNRQRLRAAALYDNAEDVIDDKALDLALELYQDFLKPTKGRWIGMLHGHHYAMLKTGETTDQRLCQLLNTRFLGTSAFIRLLFRIGTSRYPVTLWAHHGCGGGMTPGAPLNKLQNVALGFDADIYIMGHTTKSPAAPIERIRPRWYGRGAPDLVHKRVLLVNSGGFAKGHARGSMQGRVPMGSYAEIGMMPPSALGAPIIRIEPRIKDVGDHAQSNRERTWDPRLTVEV
jgi:hypothetical protein